MVNEVAPVAPYGWTQRGRLQTQNIENKSFFIYLLQIRASVTYQKLKLKTYFLKIMLQIDTSTSEYGTLYRLLATAKFTIAPSLSSIVGLIMTIDETGINGAFKTC